MRRLNTLLAIALALQGIGFGAWIALDRKGSDRVQPVALLDGLERSAISRITIETKPGSGQQKLVLAREKDGWRLPDDQGYPVDGGKLDRLLATLLGLSSSRVMARGPEHRVELKVADDDYQRKLTIEAGGKSRSLWLGSGSSGTPCARTAARPETFAVPELKIWELSARPQDWFAQPYFELDSARLAELDITGPAGDLKLSRRDLSGFQIDGQPVDQPAADGLLDEIERIELTGLAGRADDAEVRARLDKAPRRWRIRLALADEALPAPGVKPGAAPGEPDEAPGEVPDPAPLQPGQDQPAATPDASAAGAAAPPAPPKIAERRTLTVASPDGDKGDLLVWAEGQPFVVQVARYRLQKLIEADPAKLLGKAPPPASP